MAEKVTRILRSERLNQSKYARLSDLVLRPGNSHA